MEVTLNGNILTNHGDVWISCVVESGLSKFNVSNIPPKSSRCLDATLTSPKITELVKHEYDTETMYNIRTSITTESLTQKVFRTYSASGSITLGEVSSDITPSIAVLQNRIIGTYITHSIKTCFEIFFSVSTNDCTLSLFNIIAICTSTIKGVKSVNNDIISFEFTNYAEDIPITFKLNLYMDKYTIMPKLHKFSGNYEGFIHENHVTVPFSLSIIMTENGIFYGKKAFCYEEHDIIGEIDGNGNVVIVWSEYNDAYILLGVDMQCDDYLVIDGKWCNKKHSGKFSIAQVERVESE